MRVFMLFAASCILALALAYGVVDVVGGIVTALFGSVAGVLR